MTILHQQSIFFLIYFIQSLNNNNFSFYSFSRELVHLQSSIHTVSVTTVGNEDSLRASDRYCFIIFIFLMYMLL
jgi:hypothetical protein